MGSIGSPPEGGGVASGDQAHDPASPFRSPQPRPGFGAPNLALGCPRRRGARPPVFLLPCFRLSLLVLSLEVPLKQAQWRARPTLCNTGSSAPGRARDGAFALTNRGVPWKTTRDRRTRHRQKTHEISEGLRDFGWFPWIPPPEARLGVVVTLWILAGEANRVPRRRVWIGSCKWPSNRTRRSPVRASTRAGQDATGPFPPGAVLEGPNLGPESWGRSPHRDAGASLSQLRAPRGGQPK